MKKALLTATLALATAYVMAQENGNRNAYNQIVRGPYETNRFFDNMFFGAGAGINIYHGEDDQYRKFGSRIAPALDISLGKWLTPSVGLRLQYSGLKARGAANRLGGPYVVSGMDANGHYKEKFNVNNLHADVLWNVSNAISGYKETRTWNFVPYAGFGWAHSARQAAHKVHKNAFAASLGLLNVIRLSDALDLTLEARHMMVDESFDGVSRGHKYEGMTSVTAGLTVKFNKRGFKRVQPPIVPDYTPYTNQIKTLQEDNTTLAAKNTQLDSELTAALKRKPETVVETKMQPAPVALFFQIGKATLDSKELVNLDFYVKNVIQRDQDRTFTLIGSADKATGSAALNERLSQQRVKYVYDLLVNKYKIAPSRLIQKPEGDTNNYFSEPSLNRVVIIE